MLATIGRLVTTVGVAALLAISIPGLVIAQGTIEEIVVTATKREESVQDIPLSIETVSGDWIDQMAIHDMTALSATVPNLHVGQGLTADVITMRGLGTGQDRSFEQSVGMFIDGQYLPRSRQYQSPFFDIERVEVVRGPQAVLFGLNSSAGAINIASRKNRPGDDFEADLRADYEFEYSGTALSAAVGGSPTPTLGLRVAARYLDTDGYYDNVATGLEEGETEETLFRLNAIWEPNDTVAVTAKIELADHETLGNTGEVFGPGAAPLEPGDAQLDWRRTADDSTINPFGVFSSDQPQQSGELLNTLLGADFRLGDGTLSLLAGHSEFEYRLILDLDTTALPFIDAGIDPEDYFQDSLEIRYTSAQTERFEYLVGAYWHDTELFNRQNNTITSAAVVPLFGTPTWEATGFYTQESELLSLYGLATVHIDDQWRLNFGARYTDEDKNVLRGQRCGLLFPGPMFVEIPVGLPNCPVTPQGFTASRNSTNFMPEVSVQWDISDDVMGYAKWGQSAKSGGFNSNTNSTVDNLEYDDEESIGFELGIKSRLAEGAVQLNAALFQNEFDDLQVSTSLVTMDPGSGAVIVIPVIANVASSTSRGLEVEALWAPTDWLQFGLAAALLDTEYDEFPNATCNSANVANADPATGLCDLGGEPLPLAADYSGSLTADIAYPFGNGLEFLAGLAVNFSDAYFTDPTLEPTAEQDSWTTVDIRAGIGAADKRWSVSLVGRNLGEEAVLNFSQPFLGNIGYIRPPRTIALQASYRIGQ